MDVLIDTIVIGEYNLEKLLLLPVWIVKVETQKPLDGAVNALVLLYWDILIALMNPDPAPKQINHRTVYDYSDKL